MRHLKYAALVAALAVPSFAVLVLAAPPEQKSSVTVGLFTEVFQTVKAKYVEPVTDQHLVEGAIKGMLSSLDPHSSYMDAKEYQEMRVQTSGEFGGLGMQVTMENNAVKIISPIDDTPAAKAGLKPNDLIIAINGASVAEMTLSEAVEKLRGPIGSAVKIMIKRTGMDVFELSLTRAEIKVDPVKAQLEGDDVIYLRITNFSERTNSALTASLQSLKQKAGDKLVGVVLDLRNNPGGLLDQSIQVSNDFLDQGEIVSIKGRLASDNHHFEAQPDHDMIRGLPMVVLINGGSASASEIVAGALQDHRRAVLLGTRSFGKGSVQTVLPVQESGGAIRLTTSLYYTPSGRSIQGGGIQPDVVVEPAKIERLTDAMIRHEADYKNALKNTTEPNAPTPSSAPAATPSAAAPTAAPTVSPGAPPGATSPLANTLDPNLFGTDADYQLVRATDLLRALKLFKKMAAQ